jgi:phytoene dehydrogenase-like protein
MAATEHYDGIIIGGGHNGLVCGAYLARAGKKIVVLERRGMLGGASVTEEVWPGYRVNTAAHILSLMQPRIVLELELQKFGYEVVPVPPGVHLVEGVGPVVLWKEQDRLCAELGRFSKRDAETYPQFQAHLARLAPIFRRMLWEIPLDPSDISPGNLIRLAGFAWRNRAALRAFHDVTDLLTMSVHDYVGRWFDSEEVKVIAGYYPAGAAGQTTSIHTPGTAFLLLRNHLRDGSDPAGGTGLARGGMGTISRAIAASGARFGLETRTDAEVSEVIIENGRAVGVKLARGDIIRARAVISNAPLQHLFADLVPQQAAPEVYRRSALGIHGTVTNFKIHLAVDRPIPFAGLKEAGYTSGYPVQITLAPSLAYVERAYTDMRSGQLSEHPYMTVQTPTVADSTLAPPGKHIISIYGGHIPAESAAHQDESARERLFQRVMETIAIHAPAFDRRWIHRQIMLPVDYATTFRLPGGSPHHGDLTPDQLFFRRPVRGYADYTTPIPGLFICGASAHPGGGVTGVPGYNAARVVKRIL